MNKIILGILIILSTLFLMGQYSCSMGGEVCNDEIDNDADGLIDCDDDDCTTSSLCEDETVEVTETILCSDSDGNDTSIDGYTTGSLRGSNNTGNHSDYCWGLEYVQEGYCTNATNADYQKIACGEGYECHNGTCMAFAESTYVECNDSDSGQDFYTKGTTYGTYLTSGEYYEGEDSCDGRGKVGELYCTEGYMYVTYSAPPEGYVCEDGAFVLNETANLTDYELIDLAEETAYEDVETASGYCELITNSTNKDECYNDISKASVQSGYCAEIVSDATRDSCYISFLFDHDEFGLCDYITNYYVKESCELLEVIKGGITLISPENGTSNTSVFQFTVETGTHAEGCKYSLNDAEYEDSIPLTQISDNQFSIDIDMSGRFPEEIIPHYVKCNMTEEIIFDVGFNLSWVNTTTS